MKSSGRPGPLFKNLIYFLVFCFASPGGIFVPDMVSAKGEEKVKIVVKELESKGVDALLIETLTNLIRETVSRTGKYVVVSGGEGGQQMIVGTLEKSDDTYTVTLKLVDADTSKSINSRIEKVKEALAERIEEVATMLLMEVPGAEEGALARDETPPEIQHIPLDKKLGGGKTIIVATITDESSIKEATLYFKNEEAETYTPVPMKDRGVGKYEGVIPENQVIAGTLEYYIEAVDEGGNSSRVGSMSSPQMVSVEIPKEAPKKRGGNWWKWALGGVAAAGIALALGGSGGGGGGGVDSPPTSGGVTVNW